MQHGAYVTLVRKDKQKPSVSGYSHLHKPSPVVRGNRCSAWPKHALKRRWRAAHASRTWLQGTRSKTSAWWAETEAVVVRIPIPHVVSAAGKQDHHWLNTPAENVPTQVSWLLSMLLKFSRQPCPVLHADLLRIICSNSLSACPNKRLDYGGLFHNEDQYRKATTGANTKKCRGRVFPVFDWPCNCTVEHYTEILSVFVRRRKRIRDP